MIVLILIAGIIAFALSAICGGGASFILIPLLGFVLPGAQVPAALSIGTAANSISRVALFWKNVRWDIVLFFLPPAIPAVYLGSVLLTKIDPTWLELLFGLILMVNLPLIFKSPKLDNEANQPNQSKFIVSIIGSLTGFVSGLTGAVGLLFNRFYLSYGLTKEQVVATRAANELILHIIKLVLYAMFGLLTSQSITVGLAITVSAIAATFIIKPLLQRLSEKSFRVIGYSVMVMAGLWMTINAGMALRSGDQFGINGVDNGFETNLKWNRSSFALEFKYDDGFEIERIVGLNDIPQHLHSPINQLSKNAQKVILEEVRSFTGHYYEVYVYRNNQLKKYNLK